MFRNGAANSDRGEVGSVYQRVLGPGFAALDPGLRTYFGALPPGCEGVGTGSYGEAGLRVRALRPLFAVLARRRVAFAERGTDVPFTVRNIAHADGSLSAVRSFRFPTATREMTDTMHVRDGRLVDRIGARGEIEVELELSISAGGLRMESRRLALRVLGMRLPLPHVFRVSLREEAGSGGAQFVDVRISAPLLGDVYGYSGTFTYEVRRVDHAWDK